jgi:uncharacterized protein YjeT (DUF2065 family)
MERAIEILVAVCYFVIGASHILWPRGWAEFFVALRGRGAVGSFTVAFVHFPLGALIVSFHNVWTGLPVVVTLAGWGLVVKGFLYFVHPRHAERMLRHVSVERPREFVYAGLFGLAFASFSLYLALRRP